MKFIFDGDGAPGIFYQADPLQSEGKVSMYMISVVVLRAIFTKSSLKIDISPGTQGGNAGELF